MIIKALKSTMKLVDNFLIYEGCVMIWNFSLPFMNEKYQVEILKPFITAVKILEEI